jgi:hypothetical protein
MPDLGDTNDREFDGPGSEDGSFGSPPEPDADPIEEAADTPAEEPEGEASEEGPEAEDWSLADDVQDDTFEKFGKTYRIAEEDAGYSPWELYQDLKEGENREPNEMDKEILDELMMQGHYERQFEIGSSTFVLRTVGPDTRHHAIHSLNETLNSEAMTPAMRNMLIVAEQLSSFNGESTTQGAPEADFETKKSVMARIQFCRTLATPILDAIGSRVNAFRDRISTATSRSVSNF